MNRETFLAQLREGLRGLPASMVEDVLADYRDHFVEGEAAGRTDAQVAQALGDPRRLAREIRVDAGLRRWEEERNPSSAAGAIFAVLGLATLDILVLLPILMGVGGAMLGFGLASIAVFFAGCWVFVGGLAGRLPWGDAWEPLQAVFAGLGMMSGAVTVAALLVLAVAGLINALVWYGRLHFRVLKPAVQS